MKQERPATDASTTDGPKSNLVERQARAQRLTLPTLTPPQAATQRPLVEGAAAGVALKLPLPVSGSLAPVAHDVEGDEADTTHPAAMTLADADAEQGGAMRVLETELENIGLGTARLGRPGAPRNRAIEESSTHCPDNKCVAEDLVGGELYTNYATMEYLASRTLMTTGMVVWLVSAKSGTDRQTSIGPRLGGIALQGTF